jgi:hypothetical protein
MVSISCSTNLLDSAHGTEKYRLYSLLSGSYLMDKNQTFSANFLAKLAYSDKNGLQVFFKENTQIQQCS